jgi:hypothetical protein
VSIKYLLAEHIDTQKKSAKRILLNLQNLGTDDEWQPFLLPTFPDSESQKEQNFKSIQS